jgi:hypothetical protein
MPRRKKAEHHVSLFSVPLVRTKETENRFQPERAADLSGEAKLATFLPMGKLAGSCLEASPDAALLKGKA